MSDSVLFVLTSHVDLGDTGQKTGTWLEELAAAYFVLVDAGYEVELASVQGGEAPLDPAWNAEGIHHMASTLFDRWAEMVIEKSLI